MYQGFHPIRERSRLTSSYKEKVEQLKKLKAFTCFPQGLVSAISLAFPFVLFEQIELIIVAVMTATFSSPFTHILWLIIFIGS